MELTGRQFGHIRVTEVVGQGGMGDVYAGYDEKLERKVALKVLNTDQRLEDEARERLLREARALSKLDHPNICRIHDYIESADVDLLVLEYIDGRTLSDALFDRKMPRSEKLRIAVAIAEVLVTAHRAGIVHRDLKPENVMLTRNGEVKVLDFGLARWLNKARVRTSDKYAAVRMNVRAAEPGAAADTMVLPPTPSGSASPRPELATAVGITLGTPLYMSPEQARGETLTPASDMFSFGLLLQALFTGDDPHPLGLSAREVILRVARGETSAVHGAPGDVTALINRLKQFAPADRPTAVEAVERLRFLVQRPERIVRRTIVAAIALFALLGAWRYTVDLRAERALAVAARAEAEGRRAQAEDLIEFMLGDLRKKLVPVGKLDILDDVGKRAMTYVESLHPETLGGPELARASKALNQLVEVRIDQGNLPEALALAERSLNLTTAAVAKAPSDPEVQLAYGTSHFWVGRIHLLRGDLALALERMKSYRDATERIARAHPTNETYQLERAYGHSVVATIYETQGDLKKALPEFQLTRDVKAARVAAKPNDVERQADLALSLNKIGFVLVRLSDLRGARDHFAQELAIYERLSAADPTNRTWQDFRARSLGYNAAMSELAGDLAGAIARVEESIRIYEALHALDPANTGWTRNLAMADWQLAQLLRARGDAASALPRIDAADRLMRSLVEKDAKAKGWRRELVMVLGERARVLLASNSSSAARSVIDEARTLLTPIESEPAMQRTRAERLLIAGDVFSASGDARRAQESWSEAAEGFRQLPALPNDPFVQTLYARTLLRLGRGAEAAPLMSRLDAIPFLQPDYVAERARFAAQPVITSRETERRR